MGRITEFIDNQFYPSMGDNWDDCLFRERILAYLKKEMTILDLGAGAGIVDQMQFRGLCSRICGIDLDSRVTENPYLDEAYVSDAAEIPYADSTFDLVFSDNVMEHVEDPESVLVEINRVLKPGGVLLFKTPNRSHYMPLISRCTPHSFHRFYNKLRGRDFEDTFETYYLLNSKPDVSRMAALAGFELKKFDRIEGRPEYLRMFFVTYLLGLLYERVVNSSELFERYRVLIIAVLEKPC